MSQEIFNRIVAEFDKFHGNSVSDETWTTVIPTEPGWYWFFGWTSKHAEENQKPRLSAVEVRMAGKGKSQFLIYVTNGAFWYPEKEKGTGWFQNMVRPNLTLEA